VMNAFFDIVSFENRSIAKFGLRYVVDIGR
jgi:hypothetical protein